MSVNKTVNFKIKKMSGMYGTSCKWIEDNFGLDNYWCENDGVGVLDSSIPQIIERLGNENKRLRSEFEKMKDKCAELTAKNKELHHKEFQLNEAKELIEAMVGPLELYKAYGWPDRTGVIYKAKKYLEKYKEEK